MRSYRVICGSSIFTSRFLLVFGSQLEFVLWWCDSQPITLGNSIWIPYTPAIYNKSFTGGVWFLNSSAFWVTLLKETLDKYNIIPPTFSKKVVIFIPLEVLAWVTTACWISRSRLIYCWRNMSISSIFYFSKSISINIQYSNLWDTLEMMLFTKYFIKWKRIDRISWKFRYCFSLKSAVELDIKR